MVGITQLNRRIELPAVIHLGAIRRRTAEATAIGTKTRIALADTAVLAAALATGLALWALSTAPAEDVWRTHAALAALSLPLWLGAMAHAGLYRSRQLTTPGDELRRLLHAVLYGVVTSAVLPFALGVHGQRSWLFFSAATAFPLLAAERTAVRAAFARQRRRGVGLHPVVLVGGAGEGAHLRDRFAADPVLGYDVVGVVDPGHASVTDVLAAVRATGANGVVIATTEIPHELSNRLARELTDHAIHVELSSSLRGIDHRRLTVRSIGEFPFVYVEPVNRQGWRAAAKRVFDVVVAGIGLLLAAPVLAAAAVAIKVDSPGPVLFRQERIGRHGRRFRVLKLRTMVIDAEARLDDLLASNEADGPLFKMARDPRVTRVGRWLRLLSLDELPQLWNVLRGEMSLVGPRPALPREVVGWLPKVHERLRVKPGLTGMWQVHGRSSTTFDDYVRYDLYYVDNWSLTTDAAILFRTIPAVVLGRGAC